MKNLKTQPLTLSAFLFLLLSVVSCAKKRDTTPKDTEKPTLTWLKDIASTIPLDTNVPINFSVEDNVALKSVLLIVKNTTDHSVFLTKSEETNEKQIIFNESIVTKISTEMADFVITIEAEDKAGNKEIFTRNFHVMGGGGGCGGG